MFLCVFCEQSSCYVSYLCEECRALKHIKLTYKERFDEVIQNVLVRTPDKQEHKIKDELKKDIQKKEYLLRSKEKK
jgi:hypothetical protein